MKGEIEILDPTSLGADVPSIPLSYVKNLQGKVVGFAGAEWPSQKIIWNRLQELFVIRYKVADVLKTQIPAGRAADAGLLNDMAKRCAAIVVGPANGGASTVWSTYDAAEIERRGTPVILLVTESFVAQAQTIARSRGFTAMRYAALPSDTEHLLPDDMLAVADAAFTEILSLLAQPTGNAK